MTSTTSRRARLGCFTDAERFQGAGLWPLDPGAGLHVQQHPQLLLVVLLLEQQKGHRAIMITMMGIIVVSDEIRGIPFCTDSSSPSHVYFIVL